MKRGKMDEMNSTIIRYFFTYGQKNSYTPEGKKKCRKIKHTMRKLLQYITTFLNIKPEMTKWDGIISEW